MASSLVFFLQWFRPTWAAFTLPHIPFRVRWCLVLLQPLVLLINVSKRIDCVTTKSYKVISIPTRSRGHYLRALVFQPSNPLPAGSKPRPVHLHMHGGAFIAGIPETDALTCSYLAEKAGVVVVSTSYRHAPTIPFPAAVEDIEDVITWLQANAPEQVQADPDCLTLSGSSAGGTLAFAAAQNPKFRGGEDSHAVKGIVTFAAVMDLRVPPWEKRKPEGFPKVDPLKVFEPLFDVYAAPVRKQHMDDPRMSPIPADPTSLPKHIMLIMPTMDILLDEQLAFAERLKRDKDVEIETKLVEGQIHGWEALPSFVIDVSTRTAAFDAACDFIQSIQRRYNTMGK